MSADKKMNRAKFEVVLQHPFFGTFVMLHIWRTPAKHGTMETDGKSVWWSPEFVETLEHAEIVGVICHEMLHTILLHHLRRGVRDPKIWNIATDYAINQILIAANLKLPKDALFDPKYKGWSAERIYDDLLKNASGGGGMPQPQGWGQVMDGQNVGNPQAAEKEAIEITGQAAQAAAVAKKRGLLPGSLDYLITDMLEAQVDWRDRLRKVIGGQARDDYTWRRPNRKYMQQGIYMPTMQQHGVGTVVIGVDTSGSVSDREIAQFIGEMNAISDECNPEGVWVVPCDSRLGEVRFYGPGETIVDLIARGRGGTSTLPVFQWVEENGIVPDTFIYLTDLEVDFPDHQPDYPVIWCTTTATRAPWGEVIKVRMN